MHVLALVNGVPAGLGLWKALLRVLLLRVKPDTTPAAAATERASRKARAHKSASQHKSHEEDIEGAITPELQGGWWGAITPGLQGGWGRQHQGYKEDGGDNTRARGWVGATLSAQEGGWRASHKRTHGCMSTQCEVVTTK
jgi:hypothetical protein